MPGMIWLTRDSDKPVALAATACPPRPSTRQMEATFRSWAFRLDRAASIASRSSSVTAGSGAISESS